MKWRRKRHAAYLEFTSCESAQINVVIESELTIWEAGLERANPQMAVLF
jgi:hypothetical protein